MFHGASEANSNPITESTYIEEKSQVEIHLVVQATYINFTPPKQVSEYRCLEAPQSTREWANINETHGWRNRETQTLIAMCGDESIQQKSSPPGFGIISEMNSAIFAYLYICGNYRLDLYPIWWRHDYMAKSNECA